MNEAGGFPLGDALPVPRRATCANVAGQKNQIKTHPEKIEKQGWAVVPKSEQPDYKRKNLSVKRG